MKKLTDFISQGGISILKENAKSLRLRQIFYDDEIDDVILYIDYIPKNIKTLDADHCESTPASPLSPFTPISETTENGEVSAEEFCDNYYQHKERVDNSFEEEHFSNKEKSIASQGSKHSESLEKDFDESSNESKSFDGYQNTPSTKSSRLDSSNCSERNDEILTEMPDKDVDEGGKDEEHRMENTTYDDEGLQQALEAGITRNPQARMMMPEPGIVGKQVSASDLLARSRFYRVYTEEGQEVEKEKVQKPSVLSSFDNRPHNYNPDTLVKTTSTDWKSESEPPTSTDCFLDSKKYEHVTGMVATEDDNHQIIDHSGNVQSNNVSSTFRRTKSLGLIRRMSATRRSLEKLSHKCKRSKSLFSRRVSLEDNLGDSCGSDNGAEHSQGMLSALGSIIAEGLSRVWMLTSKNPERVTEVDGIEQESKHL